MTVDRVRRFLGRHAASLAAAGGAAASVAVVAAAREPPNPRDEAVPPVFTPTIDQDRPQTKRIGRGGPIAYESSACTSRPPAGPGNGRTVSLDAGHGGADPGATTLVARQEVSEAQITLGIARATAAELRQAGYRVLLTRDGVEGVARTRRSDLDGELLSPAGVKRQLEARNLCANAGDADAQVSIHLNSFADPSVRGAETVYNARRRFARQNRRLASALQRAIVDGLEDAAWAGPDRGVVRDEDGGATALTPEGAAYEQLLQLGPESPPWFRRPSQMPGAVVEPLFVTAPEDAERAVSAEGRDTLARAIRRGLDDYFGR